MTRRIAGSAEFRRANRLRDFLNYVVERSLADAPQDVTEVLIGQRVFGRPAAYNPSEDSIVRTEARNLRMRLERYFGGEGAAEPIILEIPKGAYLPVFRRRQAVFETLEVAPGPVGRTRRYWLAAFASAPVAALAGWRFGVRYANAGGAPKAVFAPAQGRVRFESSDARLTTAFQAAKQRALSFVYSGDKIGDWYDGSVGERYSFCARDVSHQSTGAAALGLAGATQNMLRRFAASISREQKWRPYWEINKDGFPVMLHGSAGDHYCLPASFDLVQACYRQFLWHGDEGYFDAAFSQFYDRTMTSFIEAWNPRGDGVTGSQPEAGSSAVPTYWDHAPRLLTGGDLMAAQFAAHEAYGRIQRRKGLPGSLSFKVARQQAGHAEALKARYNTEWWDDTANRHYSGLLPDGLFFDGYIDDANAFALLFRLPLDGMKTEAALDTLERHRPRYDQTYSYFPEILFQYGRSDSAYRALLELAERDPSLPKIPEISFTVVGAVTTGLMGILADAPQATVETLPRLPGHVEWAKVSNLPVLRNEVTVLHRGVGETTIVNERGPLFHWRAVFAAQPAKTPPKIIVDGAPAASSLERRLNGQTVVSAMVAVKPGRTHTARVAG